MKFVMNDGMIRWNGGYLEDIVERRIEHKWYPIRFATLATSRLVPMHPDCYWMILE